jgi:hypothetical protein
MEAQLIQVPNYVGKEFIFLDDFSTRDSNISFCKGMKFKITKMNKNEVTIKITSELEDCLPAIEKFAAIVVREQKREIKTLDKVIKTWTEEEEKFEVDKNSFWNKDGKGHIINTGFLVPKDHPEKKGETSPDSIMTFDYKHKDGKKNFYSYQEGDNVWYNKATYEFIRLGCLEDLKKFEELSDVTKKDIYNTYYKRGFLSKYTFSINQLNKAKFKSA